MSNTILHLIITRFMIITNAWMRQLKVKSKYDLLNDKILLPKIENLKKYYYNWVIRQTNKNFFIYIIIDNDLDMKYIKLIRNIFIDLDNVYIIKYIDGCSISYNFFLEYSCQELNKDYNNFNIINNYIGEKIINGYNIHLVKKFNYIIYSRIDDDDIISNNMIDYIQKKCLKVKNEFLLVGFTNGFVLNDTIYKINLKYKNKGSIAICQSLIVKNNSDVLKSVNIYNANHTNLFGFVDKINKNKYFKNIINFKDLNYYHIDTINRYFIYNRKLSFSKLNLKKKCHSLNNNDIKYFNKIFGCSVNYF